MPGIAQAIYQSRAPLRAFVCNVATEPGETDGYTVCDFVRAVERHVEWPLFDHVVTNANRHARRPEVWKSEVVVPGDRGALPDGVRLVRRTWWMPGTRYATIRGSWPRYYFAYMRCRDAKWARRDKLALRYRLGDSRRKSQGLTIILWSSIGYRGRLLTS